MAGKGNSEIQNKKIATVAKWKASGLSQAEFCRREGLREWQLSEWKRFVEKLDKEDSSARTSRGKKPYRSGGRVRSNRYGQTPAEVPAEPQSFVPVRLVDVATESDRSGAASAMDCVLEVVLKRGQTVRVAGNCPPQFLGAIVEALDH